MEINCMLGKFMTTDDLIYLCNNNKLIKDKFRGVFPADFSCGFFSKNEFYNRGMDMEHRSQ